MRLRVSELIGGGAFLIFTIVFWLQTTDLPVRYSGVAENPIWYPRLLLILCGTASLLLIIRGILGDKDSPIPLPLIIKLLPVLVVLAVYFWFFERLGFMVSSLIFTPLSILVMGYRRLGITFGFAVVLVVAIWLLFAEVFNIRPPGFGIDDIIRYMNTGG